MALGDPLLPVMKQRTHERLLHESNQVDGVPLRERLEKIVGANQCPGFRG